MIGEPMSTVLMASGVFLLLLIMCVFVTRSFITGLMYVVFAALSLATAIFILFIPTLIYKFIVL